MAELRNEVAAYEKERLEELSKRPNTTVFKPEFDRKHEPWKVARLRGVTERLAERVVGFGDDVADFTVRKECLKDPDFLAFQRDHPKMYYMITDRKMVRDKRFQQAFGGMLSVRQKVEDGTLEDGQEADAMATSGIVSALQQ